MDKPPLGIMPRYIWLERRLNAIDDAINRYTEAKMPIPPDWIMEHNMIVDELRRIEKQNEKKRRE